MGNTTGVTATKASRSTYDRPCAAARAGSHSAAIREPLHAPRHGREHHDGGDRIATRCPWPEAAARWPALRADRQRRPHGPATTPRPRPTPRPDDSPRQIGHGLARALPRVYGAPAGPGRCRPRSARPPRRPAIAPMIAPMHPERRRRFADDELPHLPARRRPPAPHERKAAATFGDVHQHGVADDGKGHRRQPAPRNRGRGSAEWSTSSAMLALPAGTSAIRIVGQLPRRPRPARAGPARQFLSSTTRADPEQADWPADISASDWISTIAGAFALTSQDLLPLHEPHHLHPPDPPPARRRAVRRRTRGPGRGPSASACRARPRLPPRRPGPRPAWTMPVSTSAARSTPRATSRTRFSPTRKSVGR